SVRDAVQAEGHDPVAGEAADDDRVGRVVGEPHAPDPSRIGEDGGVQAYRVAADVVVVVPALTHLKPGAERGVEHGGGGRADASRKGSGRLALAVDDGAAIPIAGLDGDWTDVSPEVEVRAGGDHLSVERLRRDGDVRAKTVGDAWEVVRGPCADADDVPDRRLC